MSKGPTTRFKVEVRYGERVSRREDLVVTEEPLELRLHGHPFAVMMRRPGANRELAEDVARKLVEVVHMVRGLDLKKPPSIAESIDWARALILLGADDIDQSVFERTLSIIVKHRTDLDVVAERVGVKLGGGSGLLGRAS